MSVWLSFIEIGIPYCSLRYGETNAFGTCPAVLGVDSPQKCFQTTKTCPVRESYLDLADAEGATPMRLLFSKSGEAYVRSGIRSLQLIESISYQSYVLDPGNSPGRRASITVKFVNQPWPDTGRGFDPYHAERDYDPVKQGSFWPKFRARHRSLRGQPLRWIQGPEGTPLDEMVARHYVIDDFSGPELDGSFTITAKDPLKFLDDDRAQFPAPTDGFLNADISASATTLQLSPAGIGNLQYPAASTGTPATHYFMTLSGAEVVRVTNRSGDTFTVVRGQKNTAPRTHSTEARAQLGYEFNAQKPGEIIRTVMKAASAGIITDANIPIASWNAETDAKLAQVFSRFIAEPIGASKLIASIQQSAGLTIWWDEIAAQFRLKVIGNPDADAEVIDLGNTIKGSLKSQEQKDKRVSQAWMFYAQFDPTKKEDDFQNYQSRFIFVDGDAEADYKSPALIKIASPWIPDGGRAAAQRACALRVGLYNNAPRKIGVAVSRRDTLTPVLGHGYNLRSIQFQNADGSPATVPAQCVSLDPQEAKHVLQLQEDVSVDLEPFDPTYRVLFVESERFNVNVIDWYNLNFGPPASGITFDLFVEEGATIGSVSTSRPALDIGSGWPAVAATATRTNGSAVLTGLTLDPIALGLIPGMFVRGTGIPNGSKILSVDSTSQITLDRNASSTGAGTITVYTVIVNVRVSGRIQGRGGNGGRNVGGLGSHNGTPGSAGGPALYTRYPLNLEVETAGDIWGGGGGGGGGGFNYPNGGGGGGGGAGQPAGGGGSGAPGLGEDGSPGTSAAGGLGGDGLGGNGDGGNGGGPGVAGAAGAARGNASGGAGGAAGAAIDGVSYCLTIGSAGDRRGPQIN